MPGELEHENLGNEISLLQHLWWQNVGTNQQPEKGQAWYKHTEEMRDCVASEKEMAMASAFVLTAFQ